MRTIRPQNNNPASEGFRVRGIECGEEVHCPVKGQWAALLDDGLGGAEGWL